MSKGFMRGLSFGIIVTCLLLFFFGPKDKDEVESKQSPINEQTLSTELKKNGQTAISIDEYHRLKELEKEQTAKPEESKTEVKVTQNPGTDSQEEEATTITYTLEVKPGMASTDISRKLADVKLLNKAVDLENHLQEKGWAGKIQIGTFELNSKMSIDQIARVITKQ